MGIIRAVAAVFEIHIDKKPVAPMKLSMTLLGDVPMILMRFRAILRWRFEFSTATATISPPKNIITTLLMYFPTTVFCITITTEFVVKLERVEID